jgi:hypothetical protein
LEPREVSIFKPQYFIKILCFGNKSQKPREISRNTLNFALFLVIFGIKQNFFRQKQHFPQNVCADAIRHVEQCDSVGAWDV